MVGDRTEVDDARWSAALEQGQKQVGQQKRREIVHRKSEFKTVRAGLSAKGQDAGVVYKYIQPFKAFVKFGSHRPHLCQRRKIRQDGINARVREFVQDFIHRGLQFSFAAAVQDEARALGGQFAGGFLAQPVRRAGD